ncbi:MAG: aminodeoxychorismate synthase, component, partial [Rhizorhabdus sp.]|nr:aminodeoxychorismate synthase, component [Rhizorhabdus sp.]
PGSTKAPRIVLVHHIKVQFCWSGVTGMMAAFSGGVAGLLMVIRHGQRRLYMQDAAPRVDPARPPLHRGSMIDCSRPFVLLDDARPGSAGARLFTDPVGEIRADTPGEIDGAFDRLRQAGRSGLLAAGTLAFEAGHAIEPRLAALARPQRNLLWFGLFDRVETIATDAVPGLLPDPAGTWVAPPSPLIDRIGYDAAFARVKDYIEAGDIYQVNLTFASEVAYAGSPLALYARLREQARAGWSAIVHDGTSWLLSFSPELFFTLDRGHFTARPMKGTAIRHADPATDRAAIDRLRGDPKQRAENLMIVDLLRNDFGRCCESGSIHVDRLFELQSFATVHHLVSSIRGQLRPDLHPLDALRLCFPGGSITGAPKIRAMQIIDELEPQARSVFCGAIGYVDASSRRMDTNITIRTLLASDQTLYAWAGGGIVADSKVESELDETRDKINPLLRALE